MQELWLTALHDLMGQEHPYSFGQSFIDSTAKKHGLKKVGKAFCKSLIKSFSVNDPEGEALLDDKGKPIADNDLNDYENVPLLYDGTLQNYMAREVLPHVPDAYIDESFCDDWTDEVGKIGFEINFNRFFYKYVPPRSLQDIDTDLQDLEKDIAALLREVAHG